jgi:hypothetical protein
MNYGVVFAPTARHEMSALLERVIPATIKFVYGDLAAKTSRPKMWMAGGPNNPVGLAHRTA